MIHFPAVAFQKMIYRRDLINNPRVIYVFGDNRQRVGMGGQAKEMRGELNAFGVPTKHYPTMTEEAFFRDDQDFAWKAVQAALNDLRILIDHGRRVVAPSDGLGTGLSQLPQRAPRLYRELYTFFDLWSDGKCPWETPR